MKTRKKHDKKYHVPIKIIAVSKLRKSDSNIRESQNKFFKHEEGRKKREALKKIHIANRIKKDRLKNKLARKVRISQIRKNK